MTINLYGKLQQTLYSFTFSYFINIRREIGQFVMKLRKISFSIKQTSKFFPLAPFSNPPSLF